MKEPATILLVEDNEDDVFLMKRALKAARIKNPVAVAEDGRAAVEYLSSTCPAPNAIFLDLKLPFKSGFEVLSWIRTQPELKSIPVVVLSSSSEPSDLAKAEALGSNFYMVKPPKASELLAVAQLLRWSWLEYNS